MSKNIKPRGGTLPDDFGPIQQWGQIDLTTDMYTAAQIEKRIGTINGTISQYIADHVSSAYIFKGSCTFANLPTADTPTLEVGHVYNVTDSFTLDGNTYPAGTDVAWVVENSVGKWNALGGKTFDDSGVIKSVNGISPAEGSHAITIPNATTTDAGLMTATDKTKLNGVAEGAQVNVIETVKVDNVALTPDANKAVNIDLSGKAEKSEMAIEAVTGDSTKKTITLKTGLSQDVVVAHQDISGKVDKVDGKGLSTNDYTTAEKNKLEGVEAGAEVNQNAFSNVTVGETTIAAGAKEDTITFVAGTNITLTPDATNKTITITGPNADSFNSKADKVVNATSGNFAGLNNEGNLTDSQYNAASFATAAQGALADTAVQDVKVQIGTGTAATIVSNKTATLTVAEGTTNGTIAVAGTDVAVHGLGSAAYTESTAYATSAQGAKADTAVQGVKLAGAENALALDANKVATIPNAVGTGEGATNGLMTAADKAKLDGFENASNYKTKQDPITDSGTGYVSAVIQNADGVISVTKTALPSQTTYTLDGSGTTVTLTPSSGSATNYTIPDVVASTSGSGGSAGVMTAAQAEKLAGIAEGAQVNVLEGVQVNGTDLTISGKKVNLTLSDAANSASSDQFASSAAVKTAKDAADAANTKVSAVNTAAASLLTALNDTATVSKTMNTANDIKAVVEALITALKTFAGAADNV